jgi:hypothetical protein
MSPKALNVVAGVRPLAGKLKMSVRVSWLVR